MSADLNFTTLKLGETWWIETIKFGYTGVIVGITVTDICIKKAALWGDSGTRWGELIATGATNGNTEIEAAPPEVRIVIPRTAVVHCVEWKHKLPDKSS